MSHWGFHLVMKIWSWLMPLLVLVITILMLLMIAPCIVNCLACCLCPGQQATTCSTSSTGYIKLQPTTENITHPQMDTAIRTLKPETSKRGRPNVPCHPSSAGSCQKDINASIPKELGLPSLEGSQNRKQEYRMTEAKRQGREKPTEAEPWKVQGPE